MGITHKCTAPYNPATNGQTNFVQTFKNALKRAKANENNLVAKLEQILLQYRAAPHASTKVSLAESFLGRKIRTKLDLIFPEREEERSRVNVALKVKEFEVGKRVACRNYTGSAKWKFGKIVRRIGKLHYQMRLDDDRIWKRHVD